MEFEVRDMAVISMSVLFIVTMSYVYPAIGLVDNSVKINDSEVPVYNKTNKEANLVDDFPEDPGSPSTGEVTYSETDPSTASVDGISLIWLEKPKSDGFSIELVNSSGTLELRVDQWSNNNVVGRDTFTINADDNGTEYLYKNSSNDWTIRFTVQEVKNYSSENMTAEVDYVIEGSPDDAESGLGTLPLIGGLFDAGEAVAGVVGYIGSVIYWFIATTIEIVVYIALSIFEFGTYMVGLLIEMFSTYTAVISAATNQGGPWVGAFMTIPLVLFGLESAKILMIIVSLLPTT